MINRFPSGISRRAMLAGSAALIVATTQISWAHVANPDSQEQINGLAFDGSSLLLAADGVWRSEDGGAYWSRLTEPDIGQVTALATHPSGPGLVYATKESGGVIRSNDGGRSWKEASDGLPDAPADAIAIAAQNPEMIYVALRGDGLWRSQDGGESWDFVMDRPYVDGAPRDILSLASVNSATGMGGIWIYAGTELGLTRVPDCFCRWQDVQPGDAMDSLVAGETPTPEVPLPEGTPVRSLALAIALPDRIFAGLASGIWKSADAGVNWEQIAKAATPHLAVNPMDPDHVVAVAGDSSLISRDAGLTWSPVSSV